MEIINWALAQIIVWIKPIKLIIILDLRPEGRDNKNSLQMNAVRKIKYVYKALVRIGN